jgi:rubrerythrin
LKSEQPLPQSLEALMAQALAMELDAALRYGEFADAMEVHNNRDVAELFREMARHEAEHAQRVMDEMGWHTPDDAPHARPEAVADELPGSLPVDELHYLMTPWHALQLALVAEQQAERFFAELVRQASSPDVQRAARELQAEEAEHVRLVQQWLAKVPKPDEGWANDPDPPRYND